VTQTPPQLPKHKVKIKKEGQRACNEKNEKGKFCGGHLKRWFYTTDVVEQACEMWKKRGAKMLRFTAASTARPSTCLMRKKQAE